MPPSARHKRIEIAHYRATVRAVVGRDLSAAYALTHQLEPKLAEVAGEDEAGACVDVGGSPWDRAVRAHAQGVGAAVEKKVAKIDALCTKRREVVGTLGV